MGRVYATTDDGARVLVRIECDEGGCSASVKPHADIAKSGWTRSGFDVRRRDCEDYVSPEKFRCPDHEAPRPR